MSRQQQIFSKGFDMTNSYQTYEDAQGDFKRIKIGVKSVDDATMDLGILKKDLPGHAFLNKGVVLRALADRDIKTLREISNFYYGINGIYERVCNYFAYLYRYDWYVSTKLINDKESDKALKEFSKVLQFLDSSYIKSFCGEVALEVVKNGCYYGYLTSTEDKMLVQQLPAEYCRVRYYVSRKPAVEFNMRFFDSFRDINYRLKVLNLFPDEFKKGYVLYTQGKLREESHNDTGWYLLDPDKTVKFNFNGSDTPMFVNAIPALLDLDAAQDLDRRKQMQKLLKIIVQKLPRDKNGDLLFDIDEARDIHNNGVQMLKKAVGVDVLTTFTDVDSIDLADKNTSTTKDDLEKVERTVFNSFGTSKSLFNPDGNLSLEKSILNDESNLRGLLFQFAEFFDRIVSEKFSNPKKYVFQFCMLETTQYNYKELSKTYKELTQIGNSKMLPLIALGHSQSFVLSSAHFENEILNLSEIMIPPLMSSTLSSEDILGKTQKGNQSNSQSKIDGAEAGRPEKPDSEKSDKTLQNLESLS